MEPTASQPTPSNRLRVDEIAPAFRRRAVQVVLGDHHAWCDLAAVRDLAAGCRALGWGLSQHSNSHLGISFAGMIHAVATETYKRQASTVARDDVAAMLARDPDWLPLLPKW